MQPAFNVSLPLHVRPRIDVNWHKWMFMVLFRSLDFTFSAGLIKLTDIRGIRISLNRFKVGLQ